MAQEPIQPNASALELFHPLIAQWFKERFGKPTPPQALGWPAIASGKDTLIAAPTGSGKTLAAFLFTLDGLVRRALDGSLDDTLHTVYVSPLKALGNDIQKNLAKPLEELTQLDQRCAAIRTAVRSGDTPAKERAQMLRKPPHILITTPESLYILLTSERGRAMLTKARTVIVDEIHAVAGDKRGSHLALSLERLDRAAGRKLQRIGLSATQKPIESIARMLEGPGRSQADGKPNCTVVDVGHKREMDLSIWVPDREMGPIASHEQWDEVYDEIARQAKLHRTTLVFVNTRALAERIAHRLTAKLGEGKVAAHHGSLSRQTRLSAEQRLKSGELPVVVATASLELGIDVGTVDLVCHIGAPRILAALLQRVGRAGHWLGAIPKGILFPMTRDELVQSVAALRAVKAGELDRIVMPEKPLDILAQQMTAEAAAEEIGEQELYDLARRAYPYRDLTRPEFNEVLTMLAEGVSTRRGRRSAWLHWDQVNGVVKGRRGARLTAITSGGAIPDTGDYDVVEEPGETFVGRINEDFAIESQAGDIFTLGNRSWRIRRVEANRVRVEDAQGSPPTIPFWLGEAPARSRELSTEVSHFRAEAAKRLGDPAKAVDWIRAETGLSETGASQIVQYFREGVASLGVIPTQEEIVAERFFDESGGTQLVIHAPFGGRIMRAWGLSLRKRFCVTFDFELQAAATDDGLVLSLGAQHSFPLESVFRFVRSATAREDLIQALLAAPMFTNRWRWNATRALALLRQQGGRKVPVALQRMRSEDLLAAVFPAQIACQDNRTGPVEVPDHPLVRETVENCLQEAMDLAGLLEVIGRLERGEIKTRAVESSAPSPFSHEILNTKPYAFLDDAPLEERRARAVSLRRVVPESEPGLSRLDPAAIAAVRQEAWPDVRDEDELHDLLLGIGWLPETEAKDWQEFLNPLLMTGRAGWGRWSSGKLTLVATERVGQAEAALGPATWEPDVKPAAARFAAPEPTEAIRAAVQGWMEILGPVTAQELAQRLGLSVSSVNVALAALEGTGNVFQGRFSPELPEGEVEWCDRRLLARIHRLTLGALRQEIEPVTPADLMKFLLQWQHLGEGRKLHREDGVRAVVRQLQGLELPAQAWEKDILPSRIELYDPADLDRLCLAGEVVWGRLQKAQDKPEDGTAPRTGSMKRNAPLALIMREELPLYLDSEPPSESLLSNLRPLTRRVWDALRASGASFTADLAQKAGALRTEVEESLWELVSLGLVTGDGMAGLRTLLRSVDPRWQRRWVLRRRARVVGENPPAGRWALLQSGSPAVGEEERTEALARQYLRRYGVVFRELLGREPRRQPWWRLLSVYRRLEARGEIRGGRFVGGFVGEQYALPEAVEALRAARKSPEETTPTFISAADPLNLVGVLTPGPRVSSSRGLMVAYRNGVVVGTGTLGELKSALQSKAG